MGFCELVRYATPPYPLLKRPDVSLSVSARCAISRKSQGGRILAIHFVATKCENRAKFDPLRLNMRSGSEKGSYSRLVDFCFDQL